VSERPKARDTAGDAGQGPSGGSGLALGGSAPVDDGEGGSSGLAGAATLAVPLLDTTLCDNDFFVRVDRLPDVAPFFSGTFDGKPVDVTESAEVAEPPSFHVFRFGSKHVEAASFPLYIADGTHSGWLTINAVDCAVYGDLVLRHDESSLYKLASAELFTVTRSVDGFSGLTDGSVSARWINDDGEQHVLEADFTLNAFMDDARIHY
jgi:hypothetical protein